MTDRCTVYGHSAQRLPCLACASEAKGGDPSTVPAPVYALSAEQVATNARGLRLVQAARTTTHAGAAGRTEEDL